MRRLRRVLRILDLDNLVTESHNGTLDLFINVETEVMQNFAGVIILSLSTSSTLYVKTQYAYVQSLCKWCNPTNTLSLTFTAVQKIYKNLKIRGNLV